VVGRRGRREFGRLRGWWVSGPPQSKGWQKKMFEIRFLV